LTQVCPVCQFVICGIFSIENIFDATAARVDYGRNFDETMICRPKSALIDANICAHLQYVPSCCIFCVHISKFSLLWQKNTEHRSLINTHLQLRRGLVWVKFRLHSYIGWPRKHPTVQESFTHYRPICYKPCYRQFSEQGLV